MCGSLADSIIARQAIVVTISRQMKIADSRAWRVAPVGTISHSRAGEVRSIIIMGKSSDKGIIELLGIF